MNWTCSTARYRRYITKSKSSESKRFSSPLIMSWNSPRSSLPSWFLSELVIMKLTHELSLLSFPMSMYRLITSLTSASSTVPDSSKSQNSKRCLANMFRRSVSASPVTPPMASLRNTQSSSNCFGSTFRVSRMMKSRNSLKFSVPSPSWSFSSMTRRQRSSDSSSDQQKNLLNTAFSSFISMKPDPSMDPPSDDSSHWLKTPSNME
mmetsp:Transcript_96178/g.165831  ORF Transcript_96178/g.165831 Transcript_96178/m.165831 type:complete len:206 (-) Transcript_96178:1898-2515(-)